MFVMTLEQNTLTETLQTRGRQGGEGALFELERDEGNRACCFTAVQEQCCRCLQWDERNDQTSLAEERRSR